MDKFVFMPKKRTSDLSKATGVYCFKEKNKVIYIGKAINIKNRVKNHFNQPSYRDNLFMERADEIGFFETNSEIEALILEANLIKKYQPKYNVMWRDDKNYFYVAITKSEKPFVYITHQKNANADYIGPFTEGTALKKTLRFLRKAFPYYTSPRHPKIKCTWCHLGLCPGAEPNLAEYKKNIKKLILILKGKKSAVLSSLKKEMKQASKDRKFEEAGRIRDRIYALQQVMAHAHVINSNNSDGFLPRGKNPYSPASSPLKILQKIIKAEKPISRIECYDVSNIQGKNATGSMVSAQGGPASGWVFDKNLYRKFRIKMKNEPNDIAMLKETLTRRFSHPEWKYPDLILIDGGKAQLNAAIEAKSYKPKAKNLKVISLAKGRQDPLRPRSEARLFIENKKNPIPLKALPQEVFNLIKNLDDEAHRFALAYHIKLRKKNLLQ